MGTGYAGNGGWLGWESVVQGEGAGCAGMGAVGALWDGIVQGRRFEESMQSITAPFLCIV